jgi:thiol-disulfide isomerase/thioredoxin/ribosomal protein L12E/L44/L45/RPP1/RPP2
LNNLKKGDRIMKKRIIAVLLAGLMVLSTGCSANVSVDPETGVVNVDGVPINELIKEADPDTFAGLSGNNAVEEKNAGDQEDAGEQKETDTDETEDNVFKYDGGIKIKYPDEFMNTKGRFTVLSQEFEPGSGVFMTEFGYSGVTQEWYEQTFSNKNASPEDVEKNNNSKAVITYVFAIDENRDLDDLLSYLKGVEGTEDAKTDEITEINKTGECTFFRFSDYDKFNAENLEEGFSEEFDKLYDMFDEVLAGAEFFEPERMFGKILGKKIEFTTTDIDGNEITSEEIFSKNKVTMVNVWATWCVWCIKELPDLNEINERLAEKDCAVVGLLGDGKDEETIAEGKQLLKENGAEYLNILPWEGALTEDLPMEGGWPTSFFVDSEGTIVANPVIGVATKRYEKIIDDILAGDDPVIDAKDQSAVTANNVNQYRIYVSDTEGNLVEGATVQLCDDSTCRIADTDESGLAVFKVDKAEYTVHVLKQPKGYKKNTSEYRLPANYSDLHIILEKE